MNSYDIRQKPPAPVFIATTIVIFFLSLSAADSIGFVPNYLDDSSTQFEQAASVPAESTDNLALSNLPMLGENTAAAPNAKKILPTRIQIASIDLDLDVQNPDTRDIAALDALLTRGPARYVDSGTLGIAGNMIIFAHSSNLPVVRNPMFKAFNKVPKLQAGDMITITGDDGKSYLYSVTGVEKADAKDSVIDLSPTKGTRLTLVTCDTLTGKSARYVLSADFFGTIGE
jgi:sortase (surface protein transpeptidase)